MRDRCLEAVHRIAREQPGGRVVVVTHTGVISQILGALEGLGPESWERNRPGPASITEVDWIGDTGVLIRFDDRKHLARLEG
jgi:broad specificity phosphatase PhoE